MYKVVKTTLEALQRCVAMLETAPNREAAEIWSLKIEGLCKVVCIIPAEFIRAFDALDVSGIDFTREVSADENPERVPCNDPSADPRGSGCAGEPEDQGADSDRE